MFEDEINRAYRQEVLWEEMIQTEGSRGGGVTRSLPLQHPHLGQDVCEHKVGQSATQLRTPKPGVSWIL